MKKEQEDNLFTDLFGDEQEPATPAQAAKPKPQPPRAAAPAPEPATVASAEEIQAALGRDAAQLFSSMMAEERKAQTKAAPPAPAPEPPVEPLRAVFLPTEEPPKAAFQESLAPWTLFRGFAVLGMLTYLAGFHGKFLRDAWGPLLVITTALTGFVLIIDFVRLSPAKEKPARAKPGKKP